MRAFSVRICGDVQEIKMKNSLSQKHRGSPEDQHRLSGFMEQYNPVRIRAGCHIVHSPYIGGFGECLLVD